MSRRKAESIDIVVCTTDSSAHAHSSRIPHKTGLCSYELQSIQSADSRPKDFIAMRNLLKLLPLVITAATACPFPGPVLPQPKALARSPVLSAVLKNFTETLDSAVAGDTNPGFHTNVTSFSIVLTDAHSTLWEYHHTAPLTTNGTRSVNSGSQYRIASITKVLTDLLLLRLGLNLEDKITKYLPGLSDGNGTVEWDRVTLRDLGSHMAGVQSNYGFLDNYSAAQEFEDLGFPPTNPDEWPPCGVTGLRPQRCTEESPFPLPPADGDWYSIDEDTI